MDDTPAANALRDDTAAVDSSEVLVGGPWRHRFVAANGARFHVAEATSAGLTVEGPLVLLLHGFPEFWWAWRHQLPALAAAGYRAVAMDLRGYGASDKPPRGYDTGALAADVGGVVRALGERDAVVVGHDWGGWLAWSMPAFEPHVTRAVAAISMAHPLTFRAAVRGDRRQRAATSLIRGFQVPVRPEQRLTRGDGVAEVLRAWGGPGFPDEATLARYRRAMRVPFVAHSAMEYYRWAVRSLPRQDGRRFAHAVGEPLAVPVLHLHGEADPYVLTETALASHRRAGDRLRWELVPGAGHYLPEERPDAVNDALLSWLPTLG